MNDTPAKRHIRKLGLQPHPEGGFYRETYRSNTCVHIEAGTRSASTAIYYLLESGDYSAWHRIASDELWHFYAGEALNIYVLNGTGLTIHRLGNPESNPDCSFQAMVPAGNWFAAQLDFDARLLRDGQNESGVAQDPYALVGCTVAPGFEFSEFELADPRTLAEQYPEHAALIYKLASGRPGTPSG